MSPFVGRITQVLLVLALAVLLKHGTAELTEPIVGFQIVGQVVKSNMCQVHIVPESAESAALVPAELPIWAATEKNTFPLSKNSFTVSRSIVQDALMVPSSSSPMPTQIEHNQGLERTDAAGSSNLMSARVIVSCDPSANVAVLPPMGFLISFEDDQPLTIHTFRLITLTGLEDKELLMHLHRVKEYLAGRGKDAVDSQVSEQVQEDNDKKSDAEHSCIIYGSLQHSLWHQILEWMRWRMDWHERRTRYVLSSPFLALNSSRDAVFRLREYRPMDTVHDASPPGSSPSDPKENASRRRALLFAILLFALVQISAAKGMMTTKRPLAKLTSQ